MEKLGFFTLSFLLILNLALGRFVVEKNNLKVTSPESIKGVYECAIGNFGVPQYGGTLVGTVVYPKSNQKACKSYTDFDISFKSKPGRLPTFVLIDRGGSISISISRILPFLVVPLIGLKRSVFFYSVVGTEACLFV